MFAAGRGPEPWLPRTEPKAGPTCTLPASPHGREQAHQDACSPQLSLRVRTSLGQANDSLLVPGGRDHGPRLALPPLQTPAARPLHEKCCCPGVVQTGWCPWCRWAQSPGEDVAQAARGCACVHARVHCTQTDAGRPLHAFKEHLAECACHEFLIRCSVPLARNEYWWTSQQLWDRSAVTTPSIRTSERKVPAQGVRGDGDVCAHSVEAETCAKWLESLQQETGRRWGGGAGGRCRENKSLLSRGGRGSDNTGTGDCVRL